MSELPDLDAGSLVGAVARREVSAEEVVRAHLTRAERVDPALRAFLRLLPERALAAARAQDQALDQGQPPLPLSGLPIGVKDVLDIEDVPTTCGSRILEHYRPPFTATAVTRLESQGAIVIGKLNMDEFAMGSSTENSAFFPTLNPWDRSRVPGGSSGGAAAAVAAHLVPVALGSDTGGSIRQPAALCGVSGLKPSYGRVSRFGLVAFASSLDQVGPLARSVADLALVSESLFGHDPRDATSAELEPPSFREALAGEAAGLRIGVPWSSLESGVDEGVLLRFREGLEALRQAGAEILDVELTSLRHAIAAYYIVATAEASSNLARYDGVRYGARADGVTDLPSLYGRTRDRGLGAEVKRRIILGTFVLSSGYYDAYYLKAQKVRTLIRRDLEGALERCDAIATPTTPTPAFRLGEKTADPLQMYLADIFTVPASLAGLPGLSIPCGRVDGLPVGLQLVGRRFDEATLLRAGTVFQRATTHHTASPPPVDETSPGPAAGG